MPTITVSLKDLQQLTGRKITEKQLAELAWYAKGELEGYDAGKDEAVISIDDTNLPYLWSAEGLARLFRGVLGLKRQKPFTAKKSNYAVIVSSSVKDVRPYITAFVAKGGVISDQFIKQLVQIQEKFCESYGRK